MDLFGQVLGLDSTGAAMTRNPQTSAEEVVTAFEDLGIDVEDATVVDRLSALCDMYKVAACTSLTVRRLAFLKAIWSLFQIDVDRLSAEVLVFMNRKRHAPSTPPSLDLLVDFEVKSQRTFKPSLVD